MASSNRTKLGITAAVFVIATLASIWLAVLLLVVAAFLIIWGQEPKRTEEFIGGLPAGDRLLKALNQLDLALSSRGV